MVLTFSRQFPAYHERKGESTFFVEQILNEASELKGGELLRSLAPELCPLINDFFILNGEKKKLHTIRAGYAGKEGLEI